MVVKKQKGGLPKKALKKPAAIYNPFEFRKNKERTAVLGKMQTTKHSPAGHTRAHAFELVCLFDFPLTMFSFLLIFPFLSYPLFNYLRSSLFFYNTAPWSILLDKFVTYSLR
jgi:hypothetical protein